MKYFKQFNYVIWVHAVGQTILTFVAIILLPFLTLHLYNQFQDIRITTLLMGIQPLTEITFTILMGGWIDRFGRRPIIIFSLLIQVIAVTGFVFADSIFFYGLLGALNGFGRFLYIPTARAQIADISVREKQAETFALLNTAKSVGGILGPILGSYLFHRNPYSLFVLAAGLLFLYFLLTMKYIPESVPIRIQKQKERNPYRFKWKEHRLLWLMMLSSLPLSFFHSQMETTWPVYLKEHMTNYLLIFSVLEIIGTATFLLFEILLVNKTSKWRLNKSIQVGYLFYIGAAMGFGWFHHIFLFSIAQVLLCIGAIIALNHLQKTVSLLAPTHFRARYFALYGLHWDISRTIGPFFGGVIMAHLGGKSLFIIIGVFVLFGSFSQTKVIAKIEMTS